ncbi:hypothetical protein LHV13_05970 [Ferrovum sp. PN-J185]|uniref:hypothetical protein n=1 Tax=Ferrovum sp. PN-J185 TaxID=1356306 RepID=UPI001E309826|nr:hypothetical protein [Ferrovum sp. PN-J185]MCC6068719.1 hypothetical protein [Ferrovum sp. PN-J185]
MAQGKRQQRERLAYLAARLLAEDGSIDFAHAKRKAARQAGITNPQYLPDNREIEEALRSWQSLYQQDELPLRRLYLRRIALAVMQDFLAFNPYLVGSVLNGYPGPHSDINIHIFSDQQKEFEMVLLNLGIDFTSETKSVKLGDRTFLAEQYSFYQEGVVINLLLLPENAERISPKAPDKRALERARINQLKELIDK